MVDDPSIALAASLSARRAWIEITIIWQLILWNPSLSARRAWIEILCKILSTRSKMVALRKESVDRNNLGGQNINVKDASLSARRAWIEIVMPIFAVLQARCRSPQGERG